jgi:hypothetical protein
VVAAAVALAAATAAAVLRRAVLSIKLCFTLAIVALVAALLPATPVALLVAAPVAVAALLSKGERCGSSCCACECPAATALPLPLLLLPPLLALFAWRCGDGGSNGCGCNGRADVASLEVEPTEPCSRSCCCEELNRWCWCCSVRRAFRWSTLLLCIRE